MEQEHDTAQHGQVAHPKHRGHSAIGQRNRGQPQQPHGNAEQVSTELAHRRPQEQHDHHRTQQVQPGQQARLGHAPAQPASSEGTDDVEQADQRQHCRTGGRSQVLVNQVGRQVNANEYDLEATDKKAQRQQPEA